MNDTPTRPGLRSIGLVLGVCLFVVAAGCLSVADTASDDTAADDVDTTAPDGQTDPETPKQDESDGPDEEGGTEAGNADESDDGESAGTDRVDALVTGDADESDGSPSADSTDESLENAHAAAVAESETATTNVRAELDTQYGAVSFNSTASVDLSSNEARQWTLYEGSTAGGLITTTFADVDSYATPDTTYKRTESDFTNETEYSYDSIENRSDVWNEETLTQYLQTDLVGNADENVVWTRDGTESFDGTETVRYVADGEEQFDGFRENATSTIDEQTEEESDDGADFSLDDSVTVTSMNATLLVGTDGVARQLTYTVEGTIDDEPVSLTIYLSITDIGSTTVRTPDWTDEAERAGS